MSSPLRKVVLTAHIISSVGWLGAVAVFAALAVFGLTSQGEATVRAVYRLAQPITWFVILPLAFASLITGIVQGLGTPWGLLQHYWVVFKLALTAIAASVLVQYLPTVDGLAAAAAGPEPVDTTGLWSYLLHAGGGLLILVTTTILSVFKPRGVTSYGRRKQNERKQDGHPS